MFFDVFSVSGAILSYSKTFVALKHLVFFVFFFHERVARNIRSTILSRREGYCGMHFLCSIDVYTLTLLNNC